MAISNRAWPCWSGGKSLRTARMILLQLVSCILSRFRAVRHSVDSSLVLTNVYQSCIRGASRVPSHTLVRSHLFPLCGARPWCFNRQSLMFGYGAGANLLRWCVLLLTEFARCHRNVISPYTKRYICISHTRGKLGSLLIKTRYADAAWWISWLGGR